MSVESQPEPTILPHPMLTGERFKKWMEQIRAREPMEGGPPLRQEELDSFFEGEIGGERGSEITALIAMFKPWRNAFENLLAFEGIMAHLENSTKK